MKREKNKYRGLFNKYYKGMPLFEIVLKDLSYLILTIRNYLRTKKVESILVYPHYPSRGSTIYKIGRILGYNITNKVHSNSNVAIYWEYLTFREEYQRLEKLSDSIKVINLYSRNISKIYIDEVHQKVFGYSTMIDPTTYEGMIVKKNDINAMHDGEIIRAPIENIESGYIYQKLIDNSYSDKQVVDIRVPVVNGMLDFIYIKYRNVSERFKNTTTNTLLESTDSVFSKEEISKLNNYCKDLNLEYGELDVLRDNTDNKIYVVDVNNTPQGPPANMNKKDEQIALEKIAKAFADSYIS